MLLIDVAFAEVRPSPWRQAVDLANMMLVLALRSDPEHVYERAILLFTPGGDRRGVRRHPGHRPHQPAAGPPPPGRPRPGRLLPGPGPAFPPIRIQRWSMRRVGLTASVLVAAVFLVRARDRRRLQGAHCYESTPRPRRRHRRRPDFGAGWHDHRHLLAPVRPPAVRAEAPCSSSPRPCRAPSASPASPPSRRLGARARSTSTTASASFTLDSDRGGSGALKVAGAGLRTSTGAIAVPPTSAGTVRFDQMPTSTTASAASATTGSKAGATTFRFEHRLRAGRRPGRRGVAGHRIRQPGRGATPGSTGRPSGAVMKSPTGRFGPAA